MRKHFQSALDSIRAEEQLVDKTAEYLKAYANTYTDRMADTKVNMPGINKRSVHSMKRLAVAAAFAVIILGFCVGGFAYYKHPVAYLSVDINPSVELGINAFDQVVSATAYNQDGQTILEGQDILYTPVEKAISDLVVSAAENGYIEEDGSTIVSVASETDDPQKAELLENAAEQGVNQATEQIGTPAVVYKDNVALARRDQARELGITPGKLNLIQKLQAMDDTITVEQYKDAPVKDIMKQVIEKRKAIKAEQKAGEVDTDTDRPERNDKEQKAIEKMEKAIAKAQERQLKREQQQQKKARTTTGSADSDSTTGSTTTTVESVENEKTKANTDKSDRTNHGNKATKHTADNTETKPTRPEKTKNPNATKTNPNKTTTIRSTTGSGISTVATTKPTKTNNATNQTKLNQKNAPNNTKAAKANRKQP